MVTKTPDSDQNEISEFLITRNIYSLLLYFTLHFMILTRELSLMIKGKNKIFL